MTWREISEHLDALRTADFESQLNTLDEVAKLIEKATMAIIESFNRRREDDDWLLIERVQSIASVTSRALKNCFSQTTDRRKRILLAIALFETGDIEAAPILIDAVEHAPDFYALAANKLANKKIAEAIPAICNRLGSIPLEEPAMAVSLLTALRKLTDSLPEKLYRRLLNGTQRPEVHTALREFKR